jgi:hypothetical protein
MILIFHILMILTLLILTTKWRIQDNLTWPDWAIFTTLLLALLAAFTHEMIQNF